MTDWDSLVRQYGPMVFRSAWRILRDLHEAEDVSQDVLFALSRLRLPENIERLLICMTVRRAIDRLRRRRLVSLHDLNLPARQPGPEAEAMGHEMLERLRDAIAQLAPRQAEVFCLRYLHDLSYEEIASFLGIRRDAVAVALHQARKRLRDQLGETVQETNT